MRTKRFIPVIVVAVVVAVVVLSLGCCGIRPPAGVTPTEHSVVVTAYCSCGSCCSWKRNWLFKAVHTSGPSKGKPKQVGITASGTRARPGTIAADTSLYPFGTIIHVPGYGYGRVEDRGGKIKGQRLDVFFRSHQQALKWGRQKKRITVWRVEE